MSATFYKYRAKDGTHVAVFRVAAGCADSIPFENREKLDLKVTPEGHVQIMRTTKEMAPEDVLIRLQGGISRLKEEMQHVQGQAYGAVGERLGSVWYEIKAARHHVTDEALYDAARDLSKFEVLGETIEKSEWKGREDIVGRARAAYLTLKPFYLKWKKLMAEKEALEKECEERAAKL